MLAAFLPVHHGADTSVHQSGLRDECEVNATHRNVGFHAHHSQWVVPGVDVAFG